MVYSKTIHKKWDSETIQMYYESEHYFNMPAGNSMPLRQNHMLLKNKQTKFYWVKNRAKQASQTNLLLLAPPSQYLPVPLAAFIKKPFNFLEFGQRSMAHRHKGD